MSKFNKTNTIKTTNKSGHDAYAMPVKATLVTQVLTTFFCEPKYYGDNSSDLIATARKVIKSDPEFVANLARYARKEMHLRSVSHALAVIIAHDEPSKPFIKTVVSDVVERPDDITEILALYLEAFGKPIPNGLKKALGEALLKFDAYAISKYSGGKKSVKFIDVLRLTHVKPRSAEQQALFSAIVNDTLPKAERWETEVSSKGNTKEVWESLIEHKKLGYMAALRNLRNMLNASPDNLDEVLDMLADKEQTLKSKQLPMRFLSAYREVKGLPACSSKVLDTLETAIEHSVANMPRLPGKTVIAVDVSGSMSFPVSFKSNVRCCDIACLLGVLASRICEEYVIYTFDINIKPVTFPKKASILDTVAKMSCNGGGTDITLPLRQMLESKIKADRLIILSDNEINRPNYGFDSEYPESCMSLARKYRETVNPDLWIHAVDLLGYGTQQFIGKNTNVIAGWNERVIEFIGVAERGMDAQIAVIQNYGKQS